MCGSGLGHKTLWHLMAWPRLGSSYFVLGYFHTVAKYVGIGHGLAPGAVVGHVTTGEWIATMVNAVCFGMFWYESSRGWIAAWWDIIRNIREYISGTQFQKISIYMSPLMYSSRGYVIIYQIETTPIRAGIHQDGCFKSNGWWLQSRRGST